MQIEEIAGAVHAGEQWVRIAEFPNYFISDQGDIHHENRQRPRNISINHRGFPVLTLWQEGNPTRYLRQLNKLVAEAFLPPPEHPSLNAVWHIDGDLLNCRASNLKWDRRDRVIAWNSMHREGYKPYKTPMVADNRTGLVYANAHEAGLATGEIETAVISHIERYPEQYADRARYRYVTAEETQL